MQTEDMLQRRLLQLQNSNSTISNQILLIMKITAIKKNTSVAIAYLLVTILLAIGYSCTNQTGKKEKIPNVNCPIIIGPRSAQFMVSFSTAYKLFNGRIKYVTIKETESPGTGRDTFGNVYETLEDYADSMIMVVEADDKYVMANNCNLLMFKGLTEFSSWFGKGCDKFFYKNANDSIIQIGIEEMQYRDTPSGDKILMTKGVKDEYWYGNSYGNVYKSSGEKGVEQIGVFSFFRITVIDSTQLSRSIVLTKGMDAKDKWCGELDGIIYMQK
jgi:hypothetical protein